MTTTKAPQTSWYHLRRVLRLFAKVVIAVLLFVVVVFILIQTPPVQNFARKKVQAYLQDKLDTKVTIGKLYIGLPDIVSLQNVYIEDRSKDTLLAGGKLKVDIDLFKLFGNVVEINEIQLEGITAKINRSFPDTIYNFQFIVDAFTPANRKPVNPNDSSVMQVDISSILLNNVHLIYKDVVTGNDMDIDIRHLTTKIDKFDPYKYVFDVPSMQVSGVKARIYQSKPLVSAADPVSKDMADAAKPVDFDLRFKTITLENIDLDYRNDVSAFYNKIKIGNLDIDADKIDMPNKTINLATVRMENTNTAVRLGNKPAAQEVAQAVKQNVQSNVEAGGWRVVVNNLEINNNTIQYDDDSKPRVAGMDYSHLLAKKLTLHVDDLEYNPDSISGKITKGTMQEQSGFVLNRLQGDVLYSSKETSLRDLLIETPGSVIRRDIVLTYPSIEAISKNLSSLRMNIDLDDTRIQVKDLLAFAPQLRSQPVFRNRNDVWYLNGRVNGNLSNLRIETLQASGLSDTRLDISGTLVGLPNPNNARGNLRINKFVTSRRDVELFVPAGSFPDNLTIPESVSMSGSLAGNISDFSPNLAVNTTLGSARIKGRIRNATKPEALAYGVTVSANNLNVGRIIQDEKNFGKITGTVTANGYGIDPKRANAKFHGIINSAVINNYDYHNVRFNGTIAQQNLDAHVSIADPNIRLALDATGTFAGEFPSLKFDATIDSVKAMPLNLATSDIAYRGKISGSFTNTDPDNLDGNLFITQSLITNFDQRFQLDTIQLAAGTNATGKFLNLTSDAFSIQLAGDYKLTQIGFVVQNSIQPYFAMMPAYKAAQVAPYDFAFSASLYDKPLWKILMPGLTRMDPIVINGNFSNVRGWKVTGDAPAIVYAGNTLDAAHIELGSDQSAIGLTATLNHLKNGKTLDIYGIALTGSIANNIADMALTIKDKTAKDKYRLGVLVKQPAFGDYVFSIKQGELLLNYDTWSVPSDNNITIRNNDLQINNFVLSKAGQQLTVNSTSTAANSPVEVRFSQFKLGTFSGFLQADTLLVDGTLNGNAVLRDLMKQPVFTTDLTITDLSIKNDTIGNAAIKVNNTIANTYAADVTITGRGNDIQLVGQYNVKPANASTYDLDLNIRQLQLQTIEGATMNSISGATGTINGHIKFNGSLQEPNILGDLNFNKAGMTVTFLNSYFTIDQERIVVDNEGVKLNTFTVKDSAGNSIVIDGAAYTKNFSNYKFDLDINADNFRAINTTKRQNSLFYGQLVITSQMHIAGTELTPVVDGGLAVTDKTDFTVVLPQQQPGLEDREGIVEFIDMDATMSDSALLAPYMCLNNCNLVGFDVSLNIEINKEAVLSMIVDEGNGDFIRMKGEGLLSGGIDKSGKISLTGSYALNEGAYELSFNFLKRRFNIEKGSSITWQGEPTTADLNVRAYYVANTAPIDLVNEQIAENSIAIRNTYRQKLPFQVYLVLQGELLKPVISFDVILPEEGNYNVSRDIINTVDMRLNELRQEPSELNKQVFSLLLLNRFMAENPFDNNGGGGLNAATFARQSVSKVLTEQLNNLATNLIQGVDINFDVVSSEDYTTGERRDRTDFRVSLSKQLLSDRLTVRVGNNFELEGPGANSANSSGLAGDVAFDYKLSRDGRYILRGYRRNEYEGVVEGYLIETGISFIITVDYNRFGDILRRKKKIQVVEPGNPPPSTAPALNSTEKIQNQNGKG